MTTIAYRDGVMAADTQGTWADCKTRVQKLFRLPCGGVMAGAGYFDELVRAVAWMQGGQKGKRPKLKSTVLLIAYGDGRVCHVTEKEWTMQPATGVSALGSGMQAALAAMYHYNATALQAVEAAASVDPSTSGPFETMAVEPAKPKPRKRK